jgi:hypothetical protein
MIKSSGAFGAVFVAIAVLIIMFSINLRVKRTSSEI